ncbi:PREDICTED: protein SIEVE ELEMENT OCCLUSION B-like [Prunus mume]|uniref:Protein SIEVE ELEMENT OCCLUSION B-like n=1 Tax=Prunus mume TaxID=102107 RepID=A0ABM1LIF6_PRUMU|nr:PREDICTED: protein SIEVE ELEMENT OCCLUSION B-like [Prunus mume]
MVVLTFKKPASQVDSKNGVENIEAADTKSLFSMTDTEILEGIYATHVVSHEHDRLDVHSLFSITESILKCSKQIVDNITQKVPRVHAETMDGITITPGFSTPLCVLKSIVREVPCKAPGESYAHDATLKILNKVSKYSWEAKAVLALAAFSLEYGEFWLSAQHQQSDQLAMSVAFLKGVPVLLKPENLEQRGKAVADLNNVMMSTLQVIDCIFQLEKLSISHNEVKELREILASARKDISVNVYWCIITMVACATNVTLLTSNEGKSHDLVQYTHKVTIILNKLKQQLKICKEEIEKLQTYTKLKQLFQIPTEVMEVIKTLIFSKGDAETTIFNGSTQKMVQVDILRTKNVLLFISSVDISEDYLSLLIPIHDSLNENDDYKIIWMPIAEEWTEELQVKFESLRVKMPWYTVGQISAQVAGIKYIKEDWNFKGKPMLVVLNTKGQLQHSNALHMISIWGPEALPFTHKREEQLLSSLQDTWFVSVVGAIHPSVSEWIEKEKYIFFYGGDSSWTTQFHEKASAFINDDVLTNSKIYMELYHVGKTADSKGGDDSFSTFWSAIETMFHIKVHNKQFDDVAKQVQKLLSYKNDKSGWAVLVQGRKLVTIAAGSTIYSVLEHYPQWGPNVTITVESLGTCINGEHEKEKQKEVELTGHACSCFNISSVAGSTLEAMVCVECGNPMETFISYKCCHVKKKGKHTMIIKIKVMYGPTKYRKLHTRVI